jgi:hypothetical protein
MNKHQEKMIYEIQTRLRTIMIGSISSIENSFGYLWNHGDEPSTDSQELFADKWEDLRLEILNKGNSQIRSAINNLKTFFEKENKYSYNYNFTFNNKKNRS